MKLWFPFARELVRNKLTILLHSLQMESDSIYDVMPHFVQGFPRRHTRDFFIRSRSGEISGHPINIDNNLFHSQFLISSQLVSKYY